MKEPWQSKAACSKVDMLTEDEILECATLEDVRVANTRKVQSVFYPEKGDNESVVKAMQICESCEVRKDCLRFSLEDSQKVGIWGGTSGRTRRRVTRMRKVYQLSLSIEHEDGIL